MRPTNAQVTSTDSLNSAASSIAPPGPVAVLATRHYSAAIRSIRYHKRLGLKQACSGPNEVVPQGLSLSSYAYVLVAGTTLARHSSYWTPSAKVTESRAQLQIPSLLC